MKKLIFSITTSLITLLLFGLITFGVMSRSSWAYVETAADAPHLAQAVSITYELPETDYEIKPVAYDWLDISATSDEQIIAADFEDNLGSAPIDIGFDFPFFDGVYQQFRLSDNGYIYFGGDETTGGATPQSIPSEIDAIHNLIAPLGGDLFRNPDDSAVYIARQTEPESRLIVQFEQAYWCCNLEQPNNFQLILYPDGRILMQYRSINSEASPHQFLTVGLENKDGTQGSALYTGFLDETDKLVDETAYLYDPGEINHEQLPQED